MSVTSQVYNMTGFEKFCQSLRRDEVTKCALRDLTESRAFLVAGSLLVGNNHNLRHVVIYVGNELSILGAHALGKAIRNSQIQSVDLQSDHSPEPTKAVRTLYMEAIKKVHEITIGFELLDTDAIRLGKALRTSKSLHTLSVDLEQVTLLGARALSDGIRKSSMASLRITAATADVYHIIFMEGIQQSTSIRHVDVSSDSGDNVLSTIVPKLQTLRVGGLVNVKDGVEQLCQGLQEAKHLVQLELTGFPLDDECLQTLSKGFHGTESLRCLCLGSVNIGIEGVTSLIDNWKKGAGSNLQELRLPDNHMDAATISSLLSASSSHPHLTTLDVVSSHNVGYSGLQWISTALRHAKLRRFDIRVSRIYDGTEDDADDDDDDAMDLEQLQECLVATKALLDAVRSNLYLQYLSLDEMDLPPKSKRDIEFYLKLNRRGRHLLLRKNDVQASLWCNVLAKCESDASAIFYFLCQQPTLMSSFQSTATTTTAKINNNNTPLIVNPSKKHTIETNEEHGNKRRRLSLSNPLGVERNLRI